MFYLVFSYQFQLSVIGRPTSNRAGVRQNQDLED